MSRCLGIRKGPNTDLYGRTSGFSAGILGDWAFIPHPGRESFLQTWQWHTLETRASPGSATPWGDEPGNAGLTASSVLARMPEPGGAEEPEASAAGPDRDSGPGSRAALSLPQRAEAQPRGSGAGGPETGWTFLDRPYTRHRS